MYTTNAISTIAPSTPNTIITVNGITSFELSLSESWSRLLELLVVGISILKVSTSITLMLVDTGESRLDACRPVALYKWMESGSILCAEVMGLMRKNVRAPINIMRWI